MKSNRYAAVLALVLVLAQLLLVLVSWILSAASPTSGVRSMLSEEGIRWYLGHFSDLLATPVLVCLLLLAMAYGCMAKSQWLTFDVHQTPLTVQHSYREHRARLFALIFLLAFVGVVLLLTFVPHAVLLSASGTLWPSPFSASLVPVTAFGLTMAAIVYGMVAGSFNTLTDIYEALLYGIKRAAPLLLFYILTAQLYVSVCFVFPVL